MKNTFFLIWAMLIAFSSIGFGQTRNSNPWQFIDESALTAMSKSRRIIPQKYLTAKLDVPNMKAQLASAPLWHTEAAKKREVIISIPMPDGSFEDFRIVEAPVMEPELQAEHPNIRSYAGYGIDDPAAYFRGDFTIKGFHGMIRSPKHSSVFIDPYSTEDLEHYQIYYRADFTKNVDWKCHFDEAAVPKESQPSQGSPDKLLAGDCQFHTYDIVIACTGEYSQYHGGNIAPITAALNTTMTRVNGVFEQDLSVHLNRVSAVDVVFFDGSTDPYTNGNAQLMSLENGITCANIIFPNKYYDLAHVFGTAGGGKGWFGCICRPPQTRGVGASGISDPEGDPFDIDYVCHEIGHQLGANHTFNNFCNDSRNDATAVEPGSGSTIMSYTGICDPSIQSNSDDYFHGLSIAEIKAKLSSITVDCGTSTVIGSEPSADAGADYTIPRSTPFILIAAGPAEGTSTTFRWEQMDNEIAPMPPSATAGMGPAFRSKNGTASAKRYMPPLQDVINNNIPTWEVLSSVGREYEFRLTVQDNSPSSGGCIGQDDMSVAVDGNSGPFKVTNPNTAISWPVFSSQTITWDVAGSNLAPVSCSSVKILLSVDGGYTYPYTLLSDTPNDGSQQVTVPNNLTTAARVMIMGNNNIFYDISNQNFSIVAPTVDFTMTVKPSHQYICRGATGGFGITVDGPYQEVSLSVLGLPPGVTGSFSPNPVVCPGTSDLTLQVSNNANQGTYILAIVGYNGTYSHIVNVSLTISGTAPPAVTLVSPPNNATNLPLNPLLTWNSINGVTGYEIMVANNVNFTNPIINIAVSGLVNSYQVPFPLPQGTTYFWRVRAIRGSCTGEFSPTWRFTTSIVRLGENDTEIRENNGVNPSNKAFELLVYPNPTNGELTMEFEQTEGTATLTIMDVLGRPVFQQTIEPNGTGYQQVKIDMGQFPAGSYTLQLECEKQRRFQQIIVN